MDEEEVKALMNDLNVRNAGVYFTEPMITPEQLIDHVMVNRVYTKEFVVINKSDLIKEPISPSQISEQIGHDRWILISAKEEENIDALRRKIFEELELIRFFKNHRDKMRTWKNQSSSIKGTRLKHYAPRSTAVS